MSYSVNSTVLNNLKLSLAESLAIPTSLPVQSIVPMLQTPKNPAHGELSYAVFEFSKINSLPPPVASERIRELLTLPSGFLGCETVGPFLNFRVDKPKFVSAFLSAALPAPIKNGEKIIVEYSSPNIAKPFHVGHLRATLLGSALDKIYRFLGYDVISINHLGDWGTQFGFVWAGCQIWGKPENPTVSELVELYRIATTLKAEQEKTPPTDPTTVVVNEIARGYFRDLEEAKPYAVEFWKWCLAISMQYFKQTYARLQVNFDHYTGESFYSDKLDSVKRLFSDAGVLKESNGALGVELGEKLGFARIATPDGRSLYLTRDIATAQYRAETFNFAQALYVVGSPQTLHFEQIVNLLKLVGAPYADKLEHVAFGTVLGMKTRGDGEFVELNDFLDEAVDRALTAYQSAVAKRPEGVNEKAVSKAVGLSAIVFGTLNRQRLRDVQFSWDTALAFTGESGPYLLYSIARLNSVIEKAAASGISLSTNNSDILFPDTLFAEDEAYQLAAALDNFYPALLKVKKENDPSFLTAYLLDVAKLFSRAYLVLRVVGEEKTVAESRLALFVRTKSVLEQGVKLLGMEPVERM